MSILQMSLSIPTSSQALSSVNSISGGPAHLFLTTKFSTLSLTTTQNIPFKTTTIRMGGGPRTFPGGVSKWQWKRMQARKAKQLLKARLARERQIYEMRKRAELKAAVSELERPWEVVQKAPTLFSVGADEQLKVLADRFQRPGGFDMWSDKDGPELFKHDDGLPSARFFPKGVVHSVKPYGKIERIDDGSDKFDNSGSGFELDSGLESESDNDNIKKARIGLNGRNSDYLKLSSLHEVSARPGSRPGRVGSTLAQKTDNEMLNEHSNGKSLKNNKFKKRRNRRIDSSDSKETSSTEAAFVKENGRRNRRVDHNGVKFKDSNADVYDLRLQRDGRYEFRPEN